MKPSEKAVSSRFDGKEITDKLGRKILLRKPSILDLYDLMSALGDDAKNPICQGMAMHVLYVAKLDGQIFELPRGFREFRAALQRLSDEGIEAIAQFMREDQELTEQEAMNSVKK